MPTTLIKMKKLHSSIALLFIRSGLTVLSEELIANPPENVYLLYDELESLGWEDDTIVVESDIPVTIKRYYDEDYFFMTGMQPVSEIDMKIVVTSNCNSSITPIIPNVTVSSIDDVSMGSSSTLVTIQTDQESPPHFLSPSSYSAIWSYTSRCAGDTPGSGGVFTQGENENSEEIPNSSSSICRTSFLLSMFMMLQGVLSKDSVSQRSLESNGCVFNAEILLDGCKYDLNVTAPTVRAINSTMVNYTVLEETQRCTTNYEADLTFNSEPVLEGNSSLYVPKMRGDFCWRPIEGRPFVDSSGTALFAVPIIASTPGLMPPSPKDELLLGQEWTKSALGEHASIASFAAFSIALMTNGAPSELVEDALNAALDEMRHAHTSFAIASRLRGEEIRPGPLPESRHEFGHDLKALAIAVAEEGCIDETLSALDAAYKAELIKLVLVTELEGTRYSGVDSNTLAWISEELRVIAMEESRHSLLAWRTLNWVCSVDSTVCDEVKREIFDIDKLERAIRQRFGGTVEILPIMQLWVGSYMEDCREDKRTAGVEFYNIITETARSLMMSRHTITNSTVN